MHATIDHGGVDESRQASRWRFYRAVWRWHFYAGLLVLPFIIWLAVTGAAFLYQDAIDRSVHHGLKVVPVGDARLPAQQLVTAAQGRYGGRLFVYTTPKRADASAEIGLVDAHGVRQVVYVDPYSARVLGALPEHGTLSWTIRRLHSLALVGPYARGLIEMAGGWAIVLVLTGAYLWWPRGRRGGVISVRGKPTQRLFWRDLHAVTGAGVGAILLFLALTGMPWSWLWGAQVNRWANGHDFGYPAGLRVQQPMSQQRLADSGEPAWSLRQARLPESVVPAQPTGAVDEHAHGEHARALQVGDEHPERSRQGALTTSAAHAGHEEHAGHLAQAEHAAQHAHSADNAHADHGDSAGFAAPGRGAIGLDAAMARFEARGIQPGYSVAPPRGATGVYTASVYPADLQRQRVIHLDQYSGAVLLDMRYRDYGPLAKLLEWGINVHLGQQYGTANQLILLFACIAIVLLCVSAAVMWWKRRPSGGLGVPPLPADPRTLRGLMVLLVLCGLIFPLVGLSLLLMWAFDRYWMRRTHAGASAR
ncbi:PepSY domain-containing protein [Xanthomonas euvesicatoria pv. eucalypti]|uniref:PepSY-associated TM helix domain-containing protein n=1 Tax=Xanthomonas euvesicatoria TaxID=456327 RepID=UPI0026E472C8|nr:PepSY domain-containing protein [Xanthomonas euvesicatoria]MDO7937950.1 PepSY domain-containing protein [Xanthomonas euvesicatoria pv. eucalypti]MDO7942693.1 PepSY domain-containing protein [Xanthomonas euvesicatoria pv. eucalypti]MDO7945981.1 PepSY domain-containing protein [Xanthomonas euvesicatoria pv. eucalypti]MDO7947817.1 PepSY domain-containing protein [Xanthomonas euvesicatoria pv. eucalypti]MDO7951593.1 PepSY domain-containing protein [Xanthomonas euvesicatoria pv. eucalypti]